MGYEPLSSLLALTQPSTPALLGRPQEAGVSSVGEYVL